MKKYYQSLIAFFAVLLAVLIPHQQVQAKETIYNSPYVTFSPDKKAWTTNAGERNVEQYGAGTRVETGISSSLRELETGEHYYKTKRTGEVPIGYWQVEHAPARCIHSQYPPEGMTYHGLSFRRQICRAGYFSGWMGYCADCGSRAAGYVYMKLETAGTIDYLPADMEYYYICPFCTNLEQGAVFSHLCKKISANRYKVRFLPGAAGTAGYMEDEMYLYNNAACYEGEEVSTRTNLPKNRFQRTGYCFAGWNTRPDGSGEIFADEQEILNLSAENWQPGSDNGIVTLYAMWRPANSKLQIDPAGGTYLGKRTKTTLAGGYGEKLTLQMDELTAPKGYRVTFDVQGGSPVEAMTSTQSFDGWTMGASFQGLLKGDTYYFKGEEGHVDLLTAAYRKESILLPEAVKEGFLFGGWYYDRKCTRFAGKTGDTLTPAKAITLYACWVDLALKAEDNYQVLDGSGAVDLFWNAVPMEDSIFRVKQSLDGTNWSVLREPGRDAASQKYLEVQFTQQKENMVVIPSTGLYRLEAAGAKSGSCGAVEPGAGGLVKASFWLQKGEVLTVTCGETGKDAAANRAASDGGATRIVSDQKGPLLEAGGGIAGNVQYHSHETCEEHRHSASCYKVHQHKATCFEYYVKNIDNDEVERKACGCQVQQNHFSCSQCGSFWTSTTYNSLFCKEHHFNNAVRYLNTRECHAPKRSCGLEEKEYLQCTLPEGYLCGKQDGEPERVISSRGGSNDYSSLAADIAVNRVGGNKGNGYAKITELFTGLQGTMELLGAAAKDLNPPEKPSAESLGYGNLLNRKKRISWEIPEDNGTLYYHQVELYQKENTQTPKLVSNRTENILTSQVKGCYVLQDKNAATQVTEKNGSFTAKCFWDVEALGRKAAGSYLHIAAVDKAGNISDTLHVDLEHFTAPEKEVDSLPDLKTEPLQIAKGENTWYAGSGLWYVRADGRSAFLVTLAGSSQAEEAVTAITCGELRCGKEGLRWQIPAALADSGETKVNPNSIVKTAAADFPMKSGMQLQLTTYDSGQRLTVEQGLLLEKKQQGKCYEIFPGIGAEYRGEEIWSKEAEDRKNGLKVIGDGEAPEVFGLSALQGIDGENIRTGKTTIHLWAEDTLSGLQTLRLHVLNMDNTCEETFEADAEGHLRVTGNPELPLWNGKLLLTVEAVDRVGNCYTKEIILTGLELKLRVERVLPPTEPIFKGGEAGKLYITVTGEVSRMEIKFPEEMTALNPELNRTLTYEVTKPETKEELLFFVPLYTPGKVNYPVTVKAYGPGGGCREGTAYLSVVEAEGTILAELRTRLR